MLNNGLYFLLLLVFFPTNSIVSSINCIDVKSTLVTTTNGIATAVCSSPYTLVSCGFEMGSKTSSACCGSYISASTCYARNGGSTSGVYAVAHCCDLTQYSVSCNTYESPISAADDDARTTASCQSDEVLMGCTAMTPGSYIDGAYPGTTWDYVDVITIVNPSPNICTGWAALPAVYSYATCCKAQDFNKITFECIAKFSDWAPVYNQTTGVEATVAVTCPVDYFMTSCSAGAAWKNMNQWSIESGNTCISRNRKTTGPKTGNAVAICCKVVTLSPTTDPTYNPTKNPSIFPTSTPTKNPSVYPTHDPTTDPTTDPTIGPSTQPTIYPTNDPTVGPTSDPTSDPTTDPTNDPTIEPTFYPTEYPTKMTSIPTTNPTVDPTIDPSNDPTSDPTKDPTLPEGGIDSKDISTTDFNSNTNSNKSSQNGLQNGNILGISSWIIYMVIGLFVLTIIVAIIFFISKKRMQKRQVGINIVHTNNRIDSDTDINGSIAAGENNTHAQIGMFVWNNYNTPQNQVIMDVTTGGNSEDETAQGNINHIENNNQESVNNDDSQEHDNDTSEDDEMYQTDIITTAGE